MYHPLFGSLLSMTRTHDRLVVGWRWRPRVVHQSGDSRGRELKICRLLFVMIMPHHRHRHRCHHCLLLHHHFLIILFQDQLYHLCFAEPLKVRIKRGTSFDFHEDMPLYIETFYESCWSKAHQVPKYWNTFKVILFHQKWNSVTNLCWNFSRRRYLRAIFSKYVSRMSFSGARFGWAVVSWRVQGASRKRALNGAIGFSPGDTQKVQPRKCRN